MTVHLAFPIRLAAGGGLATVEQDSQEDIRQSVELLLRTRPGERRCVPGYGLPDPVFGGLTEAEVLDVIEEWEDRADVDEIDIDNLAQSLGLVFGEEPFGSGYFGGGA